MDKCTACIGLAAGRTPQMLLLVHMSICWHSTESLLQDLQLTLRCYVQVSFACLWNGIYQSIQESQVHDKGLVLACDSNSCVPLV